jgi:hypothetical protein
MMGGGLDRIDGETGMEWDGDEFTSVGVLKVGEVEAISPGSLLGVGIVDGPAIEPLGS